MKKLFIVPIFMISTCLMSGSLSAQSGITAEIKVPTSQLISIIRSQLKGSKIRLNSYGKRHGYSWHKKNDSYIKVGNFYNRKFNIPQASRGPYKYNINDINLKNYNIKDVNGKFRIDFYFENVGNEIKGRCKGKWYKTGVLCAGGSDSSAPDIHINNARATAYLTPSVRNNAISFSRVSVDFNANVKIGKTCNKISYCRLLVNRLKNILRNEVKRRIHPAINNNKLRNDIAKRSKKLLSSKGIKRLISLKVGSKYIVAKANLNI